MTPLALSAGLNAGGLLVGEDVELSIDAELIEKAAPAVAPTPSPAAAPAAPAKK